MVLDKLLYLFMVHSEGMVYVTSTVAFSFPVAPEPISLSSSYSQVLLTLVQFGSNPRLLSQSLIIHYLLPFSSARFQVVLFCQSYLGSTTSSSLHHFYNLTQPQTLKCTHQSFLSNTPSRVTWRTQVCVCLCVCVCVCRCVFEAV